MKLTSLLLFSIIGLCAANKLKEAIFESSPFTVEPTRDWIDLQFSLPPLPIAVKYWGDWKVNFFLNFY
jgi:hypothetical protein